MTRRHWWFTLAIAFCLLVACSAVLRVLMSTSSNSLRVTIDACETFDDEVRFKASFRSHQSYCVSTQQKIGETIRTVSSMNIALAGPAIVLLLTADSDAVEDDVRLYGEAPIDLKVKKGDVAYLKAGDRLVIAQCDAGDGIVNTVSVYREK